MDCQNMKKNLSMINRYKNRFSRHSILEESCPYSGIFGHDKHRLCGL